jgi:hypothetical protein
MTPHEFWLLKDEVKEIEDTFGWRQDERKRNHERDWDAEWTEEVWLNRNGEWLINLKDVKRTMFNELLRIARLMNR